MINSPELVVQRPVYQQEDLNRVCNYAKPRTTLKKRWRKKCRDFNLKSNLEKTIPMISWLSTYEWRENILGDVAAGFTVAVMHIPQGMAYAMLGNVPPIVGIYMAFFPVLVYMIFGTSRHNSMGTFAVICMMTGKVVLAHSNGEVIQANVTSVNPELSDSHHYSAVQVATIVTLGVAILQLAMYVLRLGVISSLLSETLVSGFTTAAAVHVFTSQIKDLLGIHLPRRRGLLKVVYTYYDVFNAIDDINIAAMVIAGITIIAVVFNNEVLKPRVSRYCAFPIPIEMLAVVIGTVVSVQMNLHDVYNVSIVGDIPVGLPIPELPPLELFPSVIVDCFVITMVSYSISMSMALIFAQKMNYEVDANQELMAQGLGNLVGSFFSCMPFTASLSRSLVQQTVGGKTQLASLISCFLLLFVLLWIGPFLTPLPKGVLAGIIVVALKGMFLQVKDLFKFWRLSSTDALVWIITFLSVIILDIEYGLLIGALLCFAKLIALSMKPYTCKLALVPGTEIYLDTNRYEKTVELPGIVMFHYCGGLNFASKLHFRKEVFKATGVNPQMELNRILKMESKENASESAKNLRVIVLDFSALVHIDPAGVAALRNLVDDYMKIDVSVYLAGCSGPVFETMRKCSAAERTTEAFMMFPTVSDAVNYARHESVIPPIAIPSSPLWTTCPMQNSHEENCMSRL
ncbi:solute carrier family 26 member 10 isoform X2 [Fopius arisanus]|nr:PREDICTED: solute carrier family 26 member 10-like isoform X2 [Fopius arisanus]XP_011300139.1 PREDICTED: solute carrier family 26 member 10-like isoform X2 [Fopius arisanus]XP_011300140.1 PREDICTED: solute carrier family 26 member 10-like isoform X2 [Fopius arisanus]XP_011300141.1 PREDICTED: solute carrier family 26 member 10-like isoform X2 [Fopius arisanus]XP_011300142.1 PREDICTED: solute carrier family 26 member 10-like isoform X2 [Fopius arisanus]XP_011300143.1 PREDICTED: solute carrier